MDSLSWLIFLAFAMFSGSFLAGNLPLLIHLSESRLRLASAYGAGLLCSTALVVIIPEGVATLYAASAAAKEIERSLHLYNASRIVDSHHHHEGEGAVDESQQHLASTIGISLIFGFGMMFIIDRLTMLLGGHSHAHAKPSDLVDTSHHHASTNNKSGSLSTLIGLIIHCAADGVAMGAASSSHQADLEIIVFLAILLHKAPSAFGLATVLLNGGNSSRKSIRHIVLIFSAAAPISSLVTYMLISMVELDLTGTMRWTAMLLLFSGGSFLFVALVHILPEVMDVEVSGSDARSESLMITAAVTLGLFSPLVLSLGGHGH